MKIVLNIPMIERSWTTEHFYALIDWYYDQDRRLNGSDLPCLGSVSSIEILGEGTGRVISETDECFSTGEVCPMATDSPPPLPSMDAPGVHLFRTDLDTVQVSL